MMLKLSFQNTIATGVSFGGSRIFNAIFEMDICNLMPTTFFMFICRSRLESGDFLSFYVKSQQRKSLCSVFVILQNKLYVIKGVSR